MCQILSSLRFVGVGYLGVRVLIVISVVCCPLPTAWAMSMEEACGNASESMAGISQGRWLPWSDDHLDQSGLDASVVTAQHKLLTQLAQPFKLLDVLKPPFGVEVRPHRNIGQRLQMGEPVVGAKLLIQIFHPTYKEAGESSAGVKLFVNNLFPLFYGIGGGGIKDDAGPMFFKPVHVGKLGGANVYWSGRPRDCLVVYRAHQKPLWKPVSRERYLRAQIQTLEGNIEDARRKFMAEQQAQAAKLNNSQDMAQQEELLRQMQAINPEAAKQMEEQLALSRQMMQQQLPKLQNEVEVQFERMSKMLEPEINKFRAELASMTPAERASPAYLAGVHGSKATLLSQPDDVGARQLVAPATDYFTVDDNYSSAQLLVIEFSSSASHPPETIINTRLRKELDWQQFWHFVGK